jgi:PleD family two-component response regulator
VADSLCAPADAAALLEAADARLLQAKRAGRNRVLVHESPTRVAA